MEGSILHFDENEGKGIIRDDQSNRYNFEKSDFKSDSAIKAGSIVDFVAQEGNATDIFLVKGTSAASSVADGLSGIAQSGVGEKIQAMFTNGLHNKLGFFISLAFIISMFFPLMQVPLVGSTSVGDAGGAGFALVLAIVLATMFFGGVSKLYVKILSTIILIIMALMYIDLFTGINDSNKMFGRGSRINLFELVQWGAYVNLLICIGLGYITYFKNHKVNEQTF